MDISAVADSLRRSTTTAELGRTERRRLAEVATLKEYREGDVILSEGDPTACLGVVDAGRIALRLLVPARGSVTILTVECGDIFGWSAVVPPYRSTSTAIAVVPTRAVVIDAQALRLALDRDDELAAALYPAILRSVSRRLEATRLQLLDVFGLETRAW